MVDIRVFDTHIHFCSEEQEYNNAINNLLEYAEKNNVLKMGIIGWPGMNHLVERAVKEYPDKFVGYAWVDMDHDKPEIIGEYHNRGFKGLKIILTDNNYDDPSYFPYYEYAQVLGMVILFHTGIIGGPHDYLLDEGSAMSGDEDEQKEKLKGKSSARMRSIYLDTIANTFPDLKIIGAHLGWPEHMISCAVARWRKNLYFDISGGEVVRRHIIEGGYINKEISIDKLILGTDSAIDKMPYEIKGWFDSLRSIGLSYAEIDKIFYLNAAVLFGFEE